MSANAKSFTYDLSKYKGLSIARVTIKVTTGVDEQIATEQAQARNLNAAYFDELVRLSVVDFDGVKPVFPFPEYDGWNKKTRDTIKRLFIQINGLAKLKGLETALEGHAEDDATRFDFDGLPGVDVKSIAIREVNGHDEEKAIRMSLDGSTDYGEVLIAASVARVDGAAPTAFDYKALNSRTRSLVNTAYKLVNEALDVPDTIEAEA